MRYCYNRLLQTFAGLQDRLVTEEEAAMLGKAAWEFCFPEDQQVSDVAASETGRGKRRRVERSLNERQLSRAVKR